MHKTSHLISFAFQLLWLEFLITRHRSDDDDDDEDEDDDDDDDDDDVDVVDVTLHNCIIYWMCDGKFIFWHRRMCFVRMPPVATQKSKHFQTILP